MITLICGDQKKKVSIQMAESILYIQNQMKRKGWELSDDCPYEYKENALIKRRSTKPCKEQTAKADVKQSDQPRAKAKISHRDDPK